MSNHYRRPFPEGTGIFETLRTENGLVAEFGRHMRRALSAARALGIAMPAEDEIRAEVLTTLTANPQEIGRLRVCIGGAGLVVTHDRYEEITEGGYLTFSPHTSKVKGEQYKQYPYESHYEIVDEARAHGFDDAIIFNSQNNVTETGISNLALFLKGRWVTPPITAGILPGVMRAIAIECCGVEVRNIHISEVPEATAIALLSSLKIAQPVVQIGELRLPTTPEIDEFVSQMRAQVQYFSVG